MSSDGLLNRVCAFGGPDGLGERAGALGALRGAATREVERDGPLTRGKRWLGKGGGLADAGGSVARRGAASNFGGGERVAAGGRRQIRWKFWLRGSR